MGLLNWLFDMMKGQNTVEVSTSAPSYAKSVWEQEYFRDDSYFDGIINSANFEGYEIETKVHPQVLDSNAHPSCMPIAYLFKKDGGAVLTVLVIKKNQRSAMITKGTRDILEVRRIPHINFYREMENESGYVVNRIKDNL